MNNGRGKKTRGIKDVRQLRKGVDIKERYGSNGFFVSGMRHYGNDIITVAPYKPIKIMKACGTPRENQEVRKEVGRKDGFSIIRDTEVEIEK